MSNKGRTRGGQDDIDDTVSDLKEDVSALADELRKTSDDAMKRTLRRIETAVSDIYETLAEQSAKGVDAIERQVDERPWTSLLAAFGLGFLIGLLIRRGD